MLFSLDHLSQFLLFAAPLIVGFLLRWIWERWWRKKDDGEKSDQVALRAQGDRLMVVERRVDVVETKNDARERAIGRLEADHSILEGKVTGLQDFWRSEFGNLRRELRDDQQKLRDELRQDQANIEVRLTTLLTAHQDRVHDRLNVIAVDQAKLLTEFVDSMVDKKADAP